MVIRFYSGVRFVSFSFVELTNGLCFFLKIKHNVGGSQLADETRLQISTATLIKSFHMTITGYFCKIIPYVIF